MTNPRESQPAISNEVLAERVERYFEQNRTEFISLHHHLDAAMLKFEATLDAVTILRESFHDHASLPHHAGTRDSLLGMRGDQLDMEKALGQLRDWQVRNDARTEERTTNISFLDRLWVTFMAAVPTALLIYNVFTKG